MKIIATSQTQYPRSYARDNGDEALMISVQAAGSGDSSAASIEASTHWTIAVCTAPDDSNTGVSLPSILGALYYDQGIDPPWIPLGFVIDVFVRGSRPVVVYSAGGAFMNGATSKTVSSGCRFMMVRADGGPNTWAYLD